ncbi:MAG: ABC transporter substrate-binding protein [Geobacteraceae bacterium]
MGKYSGFIRYFFVFCIIALFFTSLAVLADEKQPGTAGLSREEALRLGERIYREGILPSGKPVEAVVKGDITVEGSMFSCQSCHLRAGLGSFEGGIYSPPTNGAYLFKPFQAYSSSNYKNTPFAPHQVIEYNQSLYQKPPNRPIYTDASLAEVLRYGDDPAGRILNDVMPRYQLEDREMKLLITYLKSLSSDFSPGVSDTTIRFATIITEDVSPEEQNAMLVPMEYFFRSKNQTNFYNPRSGIRSTAFRSRQMAEVTLTSLGVAIRNLSLSRWVLKGTPETWRSQLQEYYRREPVFALLGGITNGEWQPVHKFCEENQIPCLFPITEFPVISRTDWYTLYLSKGYYQEGEGAARFLNDKAELMEKPIVQIVRDSREGRALARGFQETWRDFGQKVPVTVILKEGEALTAEFLQQALAREKPAAIILWDGPESLKAVEMLAAWKNRPPMVLVSSSLLGKGMLSMNEQVRDFTYMTYPYGMSQLPGEQISPTMGIKKFNTEANTMATIRISQKTYGLTVVLDMAIERMKGNFYRDNFLDVIDCLMDLDVPLYERLSFGPGQRYASKGCYIVQLSKEGKPDLIKKSNWVVH